MLLPLFLACTEATPPSPPPTEPEPAATAPPPHVPSAYLFTHHLDAISDLQLPPSSLAFPLPESEPAKGWKLMWSEGGVDRYEAALPFRQSMSGEPPTGIEVIANGKNVPYSKKDDAGTWGTADSNTLALRVRTGSRVPSVRVKNGEAHDRERLRSLGTSGLEPKEFLVRTERLKKVRRAGLFLPSPASVTFAGVAIAPGSKLVVGMGHLLPIADTSARSDGAVARIAIGEGGRWTNLSDTPLEPGDWKRGTLPLDRWAGKMVDIRLATDPGAVAHADYVFFDEPVVVAPKAHPERVVVVIVDTLRRDHVGAYGAVRPTTPQLDAWAEGALVFDQAHAAAPWTLPSVRIALSGEPPERWEKSDTLPERLGAVGYETLAVVSNAYLSRTFRMEEVFSTHIYERRAPASVVVRLAQEQLDRLEGRDALVVLHFMDAHLPYQDHEDTRGLFAKSTPAIVSKLKNRDDLVDAANANEPGVRDWLGERYDENIRSIDNALGPFLRALPDDAFVDRAVRPRRGVLGPRGVRARPHALRRAHASRPAGEGLWDRSGSHRRGGLARRRHAERPRLARSRAARGKHRRIVRSGAPRQALRPRAAASRLRPVRRGPVGLPRQRAQAHRRREGAPVVRSPERRRREESHASGGRRIPHGARGRVEAPRRGRAPRHGPAQRDRAPERDEDPRARRHRRRLGRDRGAGIELRGARGRR